ncbi:hypothetical protein DRE_02101 [Drechslerella stenobrocha 248]|uniref:Uncharacterized protein n=1 Tax=Drechslerella stenobrocha 248 TaxID=1043628 RepID=W7I8D0_9PEZI|nr:hypothetical protein DRE_02101 [Drechslerella stenobrocha 248]
MSAPTYVRSGRGGAGNFAPKAEPKPLEVEMQNKEAENSAKDLEAQAVGAVNAADPAAASTAPQFKTYARGGAGNWYEPAALKQTGTFTPTTGAAVSTDEITGQPTEESKRSSRVWQGRGGAGNWEADQQLKAEEAKRRSLHVKGDEEPALADVKEEVRVDTEKEIKPPQSAHVRVPHLDRHQNLGDEVHDI